MIDYINYVLIKCSKSGMTWGERGGQSLYLQKTCPNLLSIKGPVDLYRALNQSIGWDTPSYFQNEEMDKMVFHTKDFQ